MNQWAERQNQKYLDSLKLKSIKEEKIIDLKLNLQKLINDKKILEQENLVQNKKQITALHREINNANKEIEHLFGQLSQINFNIANYDNLFSEILLFDSVPFSSAGGNHIAIY